MSTSGRVGRVSRWVAWGVLGAATGALCPAARAAVPPDNLLPNGDVETDDGAGAPAGWEALEIQEPSPTVDLAWDTDIAVSGTHSLLIDDQDTEAMGWWVSPRSAAIPCGAGGLALSWQQRYENLDNEFFVTLRFWTADDAFISEVNFAVDPTTDLIWEPRTETAGVPAGAETVDVVIRSVGVGFTAIATGKLWVDDVSVTAAPIIQNSDLETEDLVLFDSPAHWLPMDFGSDADLIWDATTSVSGTHSLHIDDRDPNPEFAGPGQAWWVSTPQSFFPTGVAELEVRWFQKYQDIVDEFFVTLRFWNAAGDTFMGETNFAIPQGTDLTWERRSGFVPVGPGSARIDLVIRSVGVGFHGTATGKLWVDDLSVTPAPIVRNGSVEMEDDDLGVPLHWYVVDADPNDVDMIWDTDTFVSPTHALLIDDRDADPQVDGPGKGWWISDKGLIPKNLPEIELRWLQRHEDIVDEFFVTLRFWDAIGDGFKGETNFAVPRGTNLAWESRAETIPVPAGTRRVDVVIRSIGTGYTGLATGKLWVDEVAVLTPTSCEPPMATGACCLNDGTCAVTTLDDCHLVRSGIYRGNDTPCETAICCNDPFADVDLDRDVDVSDFALLQRCLTGPNPGLADFDPIACGCLDHDNDLDVDTDDMLAFFRCTSGPSLTVDEGCDD